MQKLTLPKIGRSFGIFAFLAIITLFAIQACRKTDSPIIKQNRPEDPVLLAKDFFQQHPSNDPAIKAVTAFVKKENDKYGFVKNLTKKIGFPYWDKAMVFSKKQSASASRNSSSDLSTIVYIPFVRDSQNYTNASLIVKMGSTDTSFRFLLDWEYKKYGFKPETADQWNARDVFHIFARLDRKAFGTTRFRIKDERLLSDKERAYLAAAGLSIDSVKWIWRLAERNSNPVGREVFPVNICDDIWYCKTPCRPYNPGTVDYARTQSSMPCCSEWDFYQECTTIWLSGGGDPGSGTNPGTDPGGGGGGTAPPDPWNPHEPCDDAPIGGRVDCNDDTGWDPADDGEAELHYEPVPTEIYIKDAKFGGISTYVTPNGVPFNLPPGAKIKAYQSVDLNVFPNGALYGFTIPGPDGKEIEYAASTAQPYGIAGGGSFAAPPPTFDGYYKVDPVTRKLDKSSTGRYTITSASTGANTKVKTIRVKEVKDENGICSLVREIVELTPTTNTDKLNDDITFLEPMASPVAEKERMANCSQFTASGDPNYTVEKFIRYQSATLVNFLGEKLQSSVKVYLYDCNTGQTKYTITSAGAVPVPSTQQGIATQEYNNNDFGQDIAIKACIGSDGLWQYDMKYNPLILTDANVHPKVRPHLAQVLAEIKKQTDEEAQSLKNPKVRNSDINIEVDNGERFYKKGMNLFETIGAVYDAFRNVVKEGQMPEKMWDDGGRMNGSLPDVNAKYLNSPFKMPAAIAGGCDQLIEEVTGIMQLVKMGGEAIRHPRQTFSNIYNSVRSLDKEKLKQILSSMSGIDNYNAGGARATYQGGRHSVQAAMIFFSSVKLLTKGTDIVKKGSSQITDLQKFLGVNPQAANVLENAALNNKLVRKVDDEKLLTKNVVNGEERVVAIDKDGDVYEAKAINNVDELTDDVVKEADAHDLAAAADDPIVHTEMRDYKQNFIDGKKFERRMMNESSTITNVGNKAGINLNTHQKLDQVQLKLSTGDYFVADEVYIKLNGTTGKYEVVINEIKLSDATPFTKRQNQFLTDLKNGKIDFELRNVNKSYSNQPIPQGTMFNVKTIVKTAGDGTVNGSATFSKFDPLTNTWN